MTGALELYLAWFGERCMVTGGAILDEPGIHGQLPAASDPRARLLVWDDAAEVRLGTLLGELDSGLIRVLATAPRCRALAAAAGGWVAEEMTAMVLPDLAAVPELPLPPELTLRPVRRRDPDAPAGIPLEAAVGAAFASDPTITETPAALAAYLRNLADVFELLAAADRAGEVCATAAVGVLGAYAEVFFVNTVPGWRGRGVGRAMTAAALRAGRARGARSAALDATPAGVPIYRRLGFETVVPTTQFFRA
jgi:GNAT superfamily N-acetyltransferase